MGRTVPTFRCVIESFGVEWRDYKKALRSVDQDAFEAVLNHARKHAAAGHNFPNPNPFEPIVLSILLEHEKMLGEICDMIRKKKDEEMRNGSVNGM